MKKLWLLSIFTLLYFAPTAFAQKHPTLFSVSDIVVGAQKLDTGYLHAVGAWSDASEMESAFSVEIECLKRFGFCTAAEARAYGQGPGSVRVMLWSYDILRWDDREMIALVSDGLCVVSTLRADFIEKTVTLSEAKKATKEAEKSELCKYTQDSTVFLVNFDEVYKKIEKAKQKKP